jgi:hypothetical protein
MDCKKANRTSFKAKPTIIYYDLEYDDSKSQSSGCIKKIFSRALIAFSILLLIISVAFAINAFMFRLTSYNRIKGMYIIKLFYNYLKIINNKLLNI